MTRLAVMVIIDTDDSRLLDIAKFGFGSAEEVELCRAVVVANLPRLTRVVAVMPEMTARILLGAYTDAAAMMGEPAVEPPPGYVAPADRRKR